MPGSALPITFECDGVFDADTAGHVRDWVFRSVRQRPLCIDLTAVTVVHDSALALLADVMATVGARSLSVRGLRAHQRRILGYLGVNASEFDAATPEGHLSDR